MAEYHRPSRTNPHTRAPASPTSKSSEAWRATDSFPSSPTPKHPQTSLTTRIPRKNSTQQMKSSRGFIFKKAKRPDISTPLNPIHLTHVGFNSLTGEFTGLPREWKQILQEGAKAEAPMNDLLDKSEQARLHSLKPAEIHPHKSRPNKNPTIRRNTAQKRKGILSFIFDMFSLTKRPPRLEISTPLNPIHLTHVGFNSSTGEFTGLPKEWQQILRENFGDAQIGQSQKVNRKEPAKTQIWRPNTSKAPVLSNSIGTLGPIMLNTEGFGEWGSAGSATSSATPEMQERLGHGPLALILRDIHH